MTRPTCPHCAEALPDATLREAAAHVRKLEGAKFAKFGVLGGRPRSKAPRCACGAMTLKRAAARRHKCEP